MKILFCVICFLEVLFFHTVSIAQSLGKEGNHPVFNSISKLEACQKNVVRAVYYDQTAGATYEGYASQDFEAMYDTFDCQAADDFQVDNWGAVISAVAVIGSYNTGGPAEGFNIYIYADSGGTPGELIFYAYNQPYTFDSLYSLFTVPLDPHAILDQGIYWVSVQCRMDFSSGGQWYWHQVTGNYSNLAQWQNPGGAFLTGCTTWGSIQSCISALNTDMAFALYSVALPVELTLFKASAIYKDVMLEWLTATEINNQGFEVQRSCNRYEFLSIGFVKGHGTTTEQQNYNFKDEGLAPGKYYYRLKQIDLDGSFRYSDIVNITIEAPKEFSLSQNYPNPFNPATEIEYSVPVKAMVTLKVYDVLGNLISVIVNEEKPAGIYQLTWNAEDLPSGVYFYQLKAGSYFQTKKMVLLK